MTSGKPSTPSQLHGKLDIFIKQYTNRLKHIISENCTIKDVQRRLSDLEACRGTVTSHKKVLS